jgi:hypothetical protein
VTPEQLPARQNAANARWSKYMAREDQAYVARQAIYDRLARGRPDGKLPPKERAILVLSAAKRLSARLNAAKAASAARRRLRAEARMRLLIAYGREFTRPRPYRLEDLARASGMSISGARTAYDEDEVAEVAKLTGTRPRPPAESR